MLHQVIREDRVVVYGSSVVILTGDVRGARDAYDARGRGDGGQVEVTNSAVGNAADTKSSMQGGRGQRYVVAIERLASDMQVRTVVRMWLADHVNPTWAVGSVTRKTGGVGPCCM